MVTLQENMMKFLKQVNFDPIADKILIVFLLFAISVSISSFYIAFAGAITITREIWVGALRDFNARQSRSSATKVTFLAKIKTTIQLFTISIYLLGLALNNMIVIIVGDVFLLLSLIITTYTGIIYTQKLLVKKQMNKIILKFV